MGYKNRTHNQCRLISPRKFHRIFENNLSSAGVATVYKSHDQGFINSSQSVRVGNYVYAIFPTNKQKGNRLETYAVKYNLDNPLHFICFREYPSYLIKKSVELF